MVRDFFAGRLWECPLEQAVAKGLEIGRASGKPFTWLCVTNGGAEKVNAAALRLLGVSCEEVGFYSEEHKLPSDYIEQLKKITPA